MYDSVQSHFGCAAGVSNDLALDTKAGLDRKAITYPDDEVYTFATFEEYGWTRTLDAGWFEALP